MAGLLTSHGTLPRVAWRSADCVRDFLRALDIDALQVAFITLRLGALTLLADIGGRREARFPKLRAASPDIQMDPLERQAAFAEADTSRTEICGSVQYILRGGCPAAWPSQFITGTVPVDLRRESRAAEWSDRAQRGLPVHLRSLQRAIGRAERHEIDETRRFGGRSGADRTESGRLTGNPETTHGLRSPPVRARLNAWRS